MLDQSIKTIEKRMRDLEARFDHAAEEGSFLVARLDGRGFSRLTADMGVEKPFDEHFRDAFIEATQHLMRSGFKVVYAYTQSDEISLLFDSVNDSFGNKYRKLLSVLAGEASAKLTQDFGRIVCMDCRLLELESKEETFDYFAWRQADARRNCLMNHAYWALRRSGCNGRKAQHKLRRLNKHGQEQLLREQSEIEYSSLPAWQRHGVGLYFECFERIGFNPLTGENKPAMRRRVKVDMNLPFGRDYRSLVKSIVTDRNEQEVNA